MPTSPDPLDTITDLGYRVVWLEDSDYGVWLCDGPNIAVIDPRVPRQVAADYLLASLAHPLPGLGVQDAS